MMEGWKALGQVTNASRQAHQFISDTACQRANHLCTREANSSSSERWIRISNRLSIRFLDLRNSRMIWPRANPALNRIYLQRGNHFRLYARPTMCSASSGLLNLGKRSHRTRPSERPRPGPAGSIFTDFCILHLRIGKGWIHYFH